GSVRGMDAAAKPPWTGLRRLPQPDPPRHSTECGFCFRLCLRGGLCRRRAQPGRYPSTGRRRPEQVPYAAIR
ncbi:hypothetical protein D7Y53_23950, partial [Stenotrophomonas maltophilia]|nr:hypothetical protein [Stenotrophomonas maltophilia]